MADRILVAATLLSLLGSLGLYAYSVSLGPAELSGQVPPEAVGSYVAISGMVREVRRSWEGGIEVELLPGGVGPAVWLALDEALVLSGPREWLLTGARVRALGVLESFRGRMEMRIEVKERLQLLAPSTLGVVWSERNLLNGSCTVFSGIAYYKNLRRESITFRLLDRSDPMLELNCSSSYYKPSEERGAWGNGSLVRVTGVLRYIGEPPVPRLYLSGGAAGVEPLD